MFSSLAFHGAQSATSNSPREITYQFVFLCESVWSILTSGGGVGPLGFSFRKMVFGAVDADSLAEGCDERDEGDLEHNL